MQSRTKSLTVAFITAITVVFLLVFNIFLGAVLYLVIMSAVFFPLSLRVMRRRLIQ